MTTKRSNTDFYNTKWRGRVAAVGPQSTAAQQPQEEEAFIIKEQYRG